jgi:hypothetical protein
MRNTLFAAVVFVALCGAPITSAQGTPQAEAPASVATPAPLPHLAYLTKSKIIYVSDFDASAKATPDVPPADGPADSGSMGSPRPNGTYGKPVGDVGSRAAKIMSDAIVHDLKKAGHKVKLLGAAEAQPEDGMLVTGVFVQAGKDGHLRRASLGAVEKTSDVLVYVTTTNLYHVAKPMYAVAADDSITMNPEVAVLKFDLGKDLSYKAITKTADQVVAELERISLQGEAEGLGGSSDPLNKFSKP